MIKLTESDFSPPETFKLHWRWAKDSSLPEDEHTQTLLLVPEKAQELWDHSRVYWYELGGRLWNYRGGQPRYEPKVSFFAEESIHVISTKDTMFAAQAGLVTQIQQELLTMIPHQEMQVILMWEPTVAVATTWRLFCLHWDDFCYPIMSDVGVLPLSETWLLAYSHQEFLIFGMIAEPAREKELREQLAILTAPRPLSAESKQEIQRLLRRGEWRDLLAAIKLYSREAGVGLAKAKEATNQMRADMKRQQEE